MKTPLLLLAAAFLCASPAFSMSAASLNFMAKPSGPNRVPLSGAEFNLLPADEQQRYTECLESTQHHASNTSWLWPANYTISATPAELCYTTARTAVIRVLRANPSPKYKRPTAAALYAREVAAMKTDTKTIDSFLQTYQQTLPQGGAVASGGATSGGATPGGAGPAAGGGDAGGDDAAPGQGGPPDPTSGAGTPPKIDSSALSPAEIALLSPAEQTKYQAAVAKAKGGSEKLAGINRRYRNKIYKDFVGHPEKQKNICAALKPAAVAAGTAGSGQADLGAVDPSACLQKAQGATQLDQAKAQVQCVPSAAAPSTSAAGAGADMAQPFKDACASLLAGGSATPSAPTGPLIAGGVPTPGSGAGRPGTDNGHPKGADDPNYWHNVKVGGFGALTGALVGSCFVLGGTFPPMLIGAVAGFALFWLGSKMVGGG